MVVAYTESRGVVESSVGGLPIALSSRTSRRSIRGVSCDSLMGWWVITSRREPRLEGGRIHVSGRWDHPSLFWGEAGCASRYLGYRRHVASDTRPGWLVNSLGSGGGFFPRSWTRVLDFSRLEGVGTRHLMVVRDQGPRRSPVSLCAH